MIAVDEGIHRVEERFFFFFFFNGETYHGKFSTDGGKCSADPEIRYIVECSVRMSPGQEGVVLRVKWQNWDFWSQQKQAHTDYQAHLKSKR